MYIHNYPIPNSDILRPKKEDQKIQDFNSSNQNSTLFHNPQTLSEAVAAVASSVDENIIVNPKLAKISIVMLFLTISGFVLSESVQFVFHIVNNFSPSFIAMVGAITLYSLSKERKEILARVDYSVLVFLLQCLYLLLSYGLLVLYLK